MREDFKLENRLLINLVECLFFASLINFKKIRIARNGSVLRTAHAISKGALRDNPIVDFSGKTLEQI